jgi:hypothetical protein
MLRAQIDRDREAARTELRITERRADALARRDERTAKTVARQHARKARAARRTARSAWLREHAVALLFVPVIAVPGALAWSAMAAYGQRLYGPAGITLPAFSEGAMWAFAAATTLSKRRHPGRPVWHLRAGTVLFAAYGAALNFTHGMTLPAAGGPGTGAVMALVSAAGVLTHQIVTAGPRRTRADRDHARTARAAGRREAAARRAVIRAAAAELDGHGNARLVHAPGFAVLARRRGRTVLHLAPACPWPRPAPVLPAAAPAPRTRAALASAPVTAPASAPAPGRDRTRSAPAARTRGAAGGVTDHAAEVHFAAALADGVIPSRREIRRELHVGQDRADRIHARLSAVAAAPRPPFGGDLS